MRKANQLLEVQLEEINQLQAILREQAIRDPLTHLYNRRYLVEILDREFSQTPRQSQSLSIVLDDIDDFKSVNDNYGHNAGDVCLIALAQQLRQYFRESDILCRYGGEEFLILLPDSTPHSVFERVEELCKLIADISFPYEDHAIQITISAGTASFSDHGSDPDAIIRKADQALYASKHAGRNRVTIWCNEF